MPEPIIFIAHQKIKHGKTEEYKKYYQEVAEWMEANKPQPSHRIGRGGRRLSQSGASEPDPYPQLSVRSPKPAHAVFCI